MRTREKEISKRVLCDRWSNSEEAEEEAGELAVAGVAT